MVGQTIYIEFSGGQAGHRVERVNTNPSYDLEAEYAKAAADPQWMAERDVIEHLANVGYDILDD